MQPWVSDSNESIRHGKITKRGPQELRVSFVQLFPDLVIAGALMAGFVTIAFALWVGSVATVRAFYLRSLEREIRRVAKLENVSFGDLGLRPISFHELVVEHGSLSKPVPTTTSILVNIVVIGLIIVFGVIGSFFAFQINGRLAITSATSFAVA